MAESTRLDVVLAVSSTGQVEIENVTKKLQGMETQSGKTGSALKNMGDILKTAAGVGIGNLWARGFQDLTSEIMSLPGKLADLATSTAEYSTKVLQSSQAIGINTADMQAWTNIADKVGISQEDLTTKMMRFGKQLADGAPVLKATGFSLQSLGITSDDIGQSMQQLSDWFHKNSDEAQKAAVAQALFGRGGASLVTILNQGSGAFVAYEAHLKDLGLILNDNQLKTGALANAIHGEFTDAMKGIELQVGSRLETGFSLLWMTISQGLQQNSKGFEVFGEIIGNVVAFISGALGSLFGINLDLGEAMKGLAASAPYSGLGNQAQDAAPQVKDLAASTKAMAAAEKAAEDAINDQVKALDAAQKAYDANYTAQVRLLDIQIQQIDATKQQRDLERQAAADQAKITKDQTDLAQAMFDGDVAKSQTINEQLTSDKQKSSDDQLTATEDAQKQEIQTKKDALAQAKAAQDQYYSDTKQALQTNLDNIKQAYQDQVSAAQSANANELSSSSSMYNSVGLQAGDFKTLFAGMVNSNSSKWSDMGAQMVDKFKGWIASLGAALQDNGIAGLAEKLGEDIGNGIMAGIGAALSRPLGTGGSILSLFADIVTKLSGNVPLSALSGSQAGNQGPSLSAPGGHDMPSYAVGTSHVPRDGLAYLHQGEAVIPAGQNGKGGKTINVNLSFYGLTNDELPGVIDRQLAVSLARVA